MVIFIFSAFALLLTPVIPINYNEKVSNNHYNTQNKNSYISEGKFKHDELKMVVYDSDVGSIYK